MTLNQVKLTNYIIDKFVKQIRPINELRIVSEDVFKDKPVRLSEHAHKRLNERLGLKKEKTEYSQYIRSTIYKQKKIFISYKTNEYFIANRAVGEVDLTFVFNDRNTHYLLVTAYIDSTERFIKFMHKQYKKESRESEIEQILKDSLFNGKSLEEFFKNFDVENHLVKTKSIMKSKNFTSNSQKQIYKQELDEEYMNTLLESENLSKTTVTKSNKNAKKLKLPLNGKVKLYQQNLDDKYMETLLNDNTLVQQFLVEDEISNNSINTAPIILKEDREEKIPEQKETHKQELNEELMNELLGEFA